jgi:integrase
VSVVRIRPWAPFLPKIFNLAPHSLLRFFKWLACQPGYKSKIHLPDIEYLNLSEKGVRAAKEPRYRDFPTIEQIRRAVAGMPAETETQRRDRALVAFTALTRMRDRAIASLRLKHVDIERRLVKQDPREGTIDPLNQLARLTLPIAVLSA